MKPVVHYDSSKPGAAFPKVGSPCYVWPVDHPDKTHVSNTKMVKTSQVVAVHKNGEFETLNTRYVPL